MRFKSTRGGDFLSFSEAIGQGYPRGGGFFLPEGGVDLRSAVYAPVAAFADVVALAASELLSESLDPRHAGEIVRSAFGVEPVLHLLEDDILVLDLAGGPTGSSADYGAAFAAALLGYSRDPVGELVLAASLPRDAAALASAFSASAKGLPLVLLCEEGGSGPASLHARRGASPVIVIEVRGSRAAVVGLERAMAGKEIAGRHVIACGAATPARLVGRSLLFVGLFTLARRGLSGDLIVAAPPGDLLGLVTGLWAWSWGLPVSSFLLPTLPEGEAGIGLSDPDTEAGAEFLESFNRDSPLGSLLLRILLPSREAGSELLVDGLSLDRGSALAAKAAKSALAGGLAGHGKIVVPRFADGGWDSPPSRVVAPAALIDPSHEALEAALSRLL